MALIDDILGDVGFPTVRAASNRRRQQEFTPEQERSLLSTLGHSAISGLSTVGNLLDLPGSMVRDTVSGHNPFDQLLSPFSSENRQTGRDVLSKWGVTSPNDPNKWEAADFGGFAAEVLLDPTTYLTLGGSALGRGGQVAKNAGLLADLSKVAGTKVGPREARLTATLGDLLQPRIGEHVRDPFDFLSWTKPAPSEARRAAAQQAAKSMGIDDLATVADEPLGGLYGVGLPFGAPSVVGGSAQTAQRLDRLAKAIQFKKVPGTNFAPISALNRLFNANVGDASSQVGQQVMPDIVRAGNHALARAKGDTIGFVDTLVRHGGELADDTPDGGRGLMRLLEGVDAPRDADEAAVFQSYRSLVDPLVDRAKEWGRKGSQLFDPRIFYAARRKTKVVQAPGGSSRMLPTSDPADMAREWYLTHFTQGTDTLRQVLEHPVTGPMIENKASPSVLADALREHFGDQIPETRAISAGPAVRRPEDRIPGVAGSGLATPISYENQPEALAGFLLDLDDAERKSGVFGNHPAQDLASRLVGGYQAQDTAEEILRQLADPQTAELARRTTRTTETVKLSKLLHDLDFIPGDHNEGALKKFVSLSGAQPTEAAVKQAAGSLVPKDFAADLLRRYQSFKGPEAANEVVKAVDSVTNLFKAGVLTWPARYVRDLLGGQFQNVVADQFSPRSLKEMHAIVHGAGAAVGDLPEVAAELQRRGLDNTPEHAADVARQFMYADGVLGGHEAISRDVAGTAAEFGGSTLGDLIHSLPGGTLAGQGTPYKVSDALSLLRGEGTDWNPLNIRGVGDRTESTFAPVAAGNNIGYYTDAMNRGSAYLHLLRKGVGRHEAAARVAAAQVDYSRRAYTPFERQVMQRVFPFYKFSKSNIPFTLSKLWEQPGGKLAQTIRAQNRARGDDPTMPEYVADTAAIPLGRLPDGSNRYVTGFGLPTEDPLSFLGGGFPGGLREAASRLNPLLKFLGEEATGESFFQKGPNGGRDLADLDPTLGRIIANVTGSEQPVRFAGSQTIEHILANSPLSRALTTVRTATDPRKQDWTLPLALGTGIKVSDISPASQSNAIRQRADALMKELGARGYTRTYFPDEDVAALSNEERLKALQLQLLQKALAAKAREKRKLTPVD